MIRSDANRCGRAMIRKTSLLHKIGPTARRSGFADMSIAAASKPARLSSPACFTAGNTWRRRAAHILSPRMAQEHMRSARIDLLFTMSDNTRTAARAGGATN
jgi:hypothetical protein